MGRARNLIEGGKRVIMKTNIINAIKSKRKVELNYKGEGYRIVCPHAIYISTIGNTLVDFYQLSGYSTHSEKIPDWRTFDIEKITALKILDDTFDVAPGYNPFSNKYSNAIAKI